MVTPMSAPLAEERVSPDTAGEKPVRERLQKASIDASTAKEDEEAAAVAGEANQEPSASGIADDKDTRGRPQRKRSYDEATEGREKSPESKHGRKRSRDNVAENDHSGDSSKRQSLDSPRLAGTGGDKTTANGERKSNELKRSGISTPPSEGAAELDTEAVVSPKSKRSRVGTKSADHTSDATLEAGTQTDKTPSLHRAEVTGGQAELPAGKDVGTAGTADKDKTGSKADACSTKSPEKPTASQTSSTAFASSGFGAFASSTTSGFGAISSGSKLSSFASPEPECEPKDAAKSSASTFGGALGATPAFGSSTKSAFGSGSGFGSGFGSGTGFGGGFGAAGTGKLSSFAGSALPPLGSKSKPAKAFGAPADEDEDDDSGEEKGNDEAKIRSPRDDTEGKRDERFFAQETETGEENERTEFTCRAKLYNFVSSDPNDPTAKKEWKERGVGTLRLNVSTEAAGSSSTDVESGKATEAGDKSSITAAGAKPTARLVMRADGSHRVILNTPVKKELRFGSVTGDAPQGQFVHFMGSIDSKPKLELLQLKMRQQIAGELYDHIVALQRAM